MARVGPVLIRGEAAALRDGETEEAEIIRRYLIDVNLLRRVDPGEIHGAVAISGDVLKQRSLFAPQIKASLRSSDGWSVVACGTEHDDSPRIGRGDRFQQDAVDDGENSDVGPDAKRERGKRGEGEARIAEESAERVFKVVEERVHLLSSLDEVEAELSFGFSVGNSECHRS